MNGSHKSAFRFIKDLLSCAKEPGLEGPNWNTEHGASFWARQLVEIGHRERLSKRGSHFSQDPADHLKSLPFRVNHFRIRFRGRNIFRPVDFTRAAVLGQRLRCGWLTFALDHESGVQYDAREPGPEGRSALETPQVEIPGKKGILDCVFGVFSIAKDGIGHRYEFRARRHEHRFESFPSNDLRSSFHNRVGLATWRLAAGGRSGPFSCSENGQGLANWRRIAAPNETPGSRCVGHWRSPFLHLLRHANVCPRPTSPSAAAMRFVFNGKEKCRRAARKREIF